MYFHSATWLDVIFRHRHLSSTLCLPVELVLSDSVNEVYVLEPPPKKKLRACEISFFFQEIN